MTISGVLPSVLVLQKHLNTVQVNTLFRMKGALRDSLNTRFSGIFDLCNPGKEVDHSVSIVLHWLHALNGF